MGALFWCGTACGHVGAMGAFLGWLFWMGDGYDDMVIFEVFLRTSQLTRIYVVFRNGKMMMSGWWFGTFFCSIIYGMSSFPLTNSYFSRWLLHRQADVH